MDLAGLQERKSSLEASLKQIEQSFHIVTGHLAEVNYQIGLVPEECTECPDDNHCVMESAPLQ